MRRTVIAVLALVLFASGAKGAMGWAWPGRRSANDASAIYYNPVGLAFFEV